jgi:hypothetical protein
MKRTIQCENFGCLKLIHNLLDEKLDQESNAKIVKSLRKSYECLPIFFRVFKRNPYGREYYESRIRSHLKEIIDYVEYDYVKPRLLKEDMNNQFPIYSLFF